MAENSQPLFDADQYRLLDFGAGRRLEQFAAIVLDRPCPAVELLPQSSPPLWAQAAARFDRGDREPGRWTLRGEPPERWSLVRGRLQFELKRSEFGHVGLFPEHAAHWDWIAQQVRGAAARGDARPVRVLNLFAYTGGSTLAAAVAGAEVTHVDGAANVVGWARRNAELSGLGQAPIRWIAEDATKFVKRELRRGNCYEAVILDPPSYGHGRHGEVWRLAQHLPRLLDLCGELTADRRQFVLLTCHTPGYDPPRLQRLLADTLGGTAPGAIDGEPLAITAADGRRLPSGSAAYWQRTPPGGLA